MVAVIMVNLNVVDTAQGGHCGSAIIITFISALNVLNRYKIFFLLIAALFKLLNVQSKQLFC